MRSSYLVLALLTACGGDNDMPVDASVDTPVDTPVDSPAACNISTSDFGSLGTRPGAATWDGNGEPGVGLGGLFIPLEEGAEPDQLYVSLWGGTQNNPEPMVPGTYPLTGPELQFSTCAVCVTVGANWAPGAPAPLDDAFMATGGTVVISTLVTESGGAFEISFEDLTFVHAELGPSGSVPKNDGCVTAISDVSFSGTFE